MYTVAVRTDFIAQHFPIGGDWGPENEHNSHHDVLELELSGRELDHHGYLVDIIRVETALGDVHATSAVRLLNDLPEFAGLNPSIEHFARILCRRLNNQLASPNLTSIGVRLWENEVASAAYREQL